MPSLLRRHSDLRARPAADVSYAALRNRHKSLLVEARRLKRAAMLDSLTTVLNRRALDDALAECWERFSREGTSFGVILCDIDHFKKVNDTRGHLVGDEVLTAVARSLATALRGDDKFGRYGGEEFLAIVDTDSASRLRDVAERLRLRLAATEPAGLPVTASFGAALAADFECLNDLLAAADRALYAAKAQGRDCTCVSIPGESGPLPSPMGQAGHDKGIDPAGAERRSKGTVPSQALDLADDGLLVIDADGCVIQWNRAIARITDLSPSVLATATLATIDACFAPAAICGDEHGSQGAAELRSPVRFVTSPASRTYERRLQPFGTGDGRDGWLLTFREVSSGSIHAQPGEGEDSDRRRHALRMETVGRLAGGIAHDFNNMLTAMLGYAEVLESEVGPRDSLSQIRRAARSAADLTRQLLAFSRQQRLEPQVVDVSSVVTGLGALIGRLLGEDIRLAIDAPDGLPSVCADPTQVEQIVVNLAINARDAMPRGGDLRLRVRSYFLERPRPGREVQGSGTYLQIVVEDTGVGIDPALLPRIFEPFFTTKGLQGTGLGLSTVYGIVKQSGGFIWVESTVGQGTTFTIELPVTNETAARSDAAAVPQCPAPSDGARILVVEDQENVRLLTCELLASSGYDVIACATPFDALERATDGEVDLVLTDVTMPGMTGAELATALRERRPELPVLFMSGLPKALDACEPGAILPKPFTRASLVAHVQRRHASASGALTDPSAREASASIS